MTSVAIAHDYLTQRGGAERVVLNLMDAFPDAPVYTSLFDADGTYPEFASATVVTSPLDRIKFIRNHFRVALPLFGWAFDHTPVAPETDVVVVSTTGFAHGIKSPGRKVVYCHSPARFLYLVEDYLGGPWWRKPTGWALMALRPLLVRWDKRAAASADLYLANSTIVKDRIQRVYGIDATLLHPPASIDPAGEQADIPELADWDSYHLLVSRLLPYKNVDVAIEAFRQLPDERLLVIGRGPLRDKLSAGLPGNVRMAEGLTDAQMRRAYAGATAVVAPSHEDFGLTPIEGFSFGVPTIALRSGGYLDTVVESVSGLFFDQATPTAVAEAVSRLKSAPIERELVLKHAENFSPATFNARLRAIVAELAAGNED